MKDMIIGCVTRYDYNAVENWVNSINKSGFDGYKMMMIFEGKPDFVNRLIKEGFTIYAFQQDASGNFYYPVNGYNIVVERFLHLFEIMDKFQRSDVRYVITTDVKDVVFQKNPSIWISDLLHRASDDMPTKYARNKIIVSSEGIPYQYETWGNNNLKQSFPYVYSQMLKNTIYNAGVLAGDPKYLKDLCLNVYSICAHMPRFISGGGGPDQAALNILLNMEPYKNITYFADSQDAWAAQLGTTADPNKIPYYRNHLVDVEPIIKDGKVFSGNEYTKDHLYYIVHQYDRVPELKKAYDHE